MSTKKPTYEELNKKLAKTEALLAKLQKKESKSKNVLGTARDQRNVARDKHQTALIDTKEYLEAYKASEQNFKNSMDASPLGIRIITADGALIYANQAILEICGYKTAQEFAAVPRNKLYTPESYQAHVERKKKRALKEYAPLEYEISILRPDGEVRNLQVFRREVIWGGEQQFMALYQDITERKRAEEALRESEERFRGIFEQGQIGIIFSGLDYQIIFVNDQLCKMLGYTERELRSMELKNINIPEDINQDDAYLKALADGKIGYFHREKRVFKKNKEIIWQNLTVTMVRDKNDKPLGYLSMIEDITERKQTEEALKESENRFHTIVEQSNDGIVFIQNGIVQYCNSKMLEIGSYTQAEVLGKPFIDFVTPESRKMVFDFYSKRVAGKKTQERYEASLLGKDGRIVYAEISASLISYKQEQVDIAIVRDISGRKRVEKELTDEATRRRILIEQSRDGIVILDQDGNVYEANQRFVDMLGYTMEEMKKLHVFDWEFLYPKERIVEMIRTVDEKGDHFETQHRRKDGTTYDVEISTNGAMFGGQKLIFCVCRDITERKQMEQSIRESEEKFSKAFLASPAIIGITSIKDGTYIDVNDSYTQITGYSREELIGKQTNTIKIWANEQDRARMFRILKEQGRVNKEEFDFRMKSGEIRTWLFSAEPITFGGEACLIGVSVDITERNRAAEELERERQDIKLIMDTSRALIWNKDIDGKFLRVNEAFAKAINIPAGDFIGKTVFDIYSKDIAQSMTDDDNEVLKSRRPKLNIVEQYESAAGLRWVQTDKVPVLDNNGKPIAIIGFAQDITELKQTEDALKDRETFLDSIIENTPNALWVSDEKGTVIRMNQALRDLLRLKNEEVIGKYNVLQDIQVIEQGLLPLVKSVFEKGKTVNFTINYYTAKETQLSPSQPTHKILEITISAVKDEKGKVTNAISQEKDITEQEEARLALQESEERFRTLFETMAQGVIYHDNEGRVIAANPAAERILGLKLDEMIGKTSLNPERKRLREDGSEFPSEEHPSIVALRTGKPVNNVIMAVYNPVEKDYRWIINNAIPEFRRGEKKPYRVYTTFTDITGRKQGEQRINNLNQTLRSIRNVNQIITREKDRDKLLQGVCDTLVENRSFYMAWIALFDESSRLTKCVQSGMQGDFSPMLEALKKGNLPPCVDKALKTDRAITVEDPANCTGCEMFEKSLNYSAMSVRLEYSGNIYGVLCASLSKEIIADKNEVSLFEEVGTDISFALYNMDLQSEYERLEQERLRAAKLESIGTLAGGIAHDFNNLLTGIMGNIGMAKTNMNPTEATYEMLEEAEKAALRARDLTQQLLTFARGGKPIKKTAQIAGIIKESATFALRGSNVKLDISLPDDLWPVEADEGQISQVINNMVLNADEAMPAGGTLKIQAENVTLKSTAVPLLPGGDYVRIDIIDSGIGISAEHLQKIFEPYFTTKQRGSGLGLTSAYSIVRNHGGTILTESTQNKGSTFHIYLPATKKPLTKGGKRMTAEKAGQAGGKILVMDDEEIIRKMLKNMLSLAGYTVELSADGAEALEKYQQAIKERDPFSAVIMDLTIPGGMGGKDAVQKLLEIDPNAVAIVSSGYATDAIMSDYKAYGFSAVIAKPYSAKQLQETLSGLLTQKKK